MIILLILVMMIVLNRLPLRSIIYFSDMLMNGKKYHKNINKIGKMMAVVESKNRIVGSASIKSNIYYSDYDFFEKVNEVSEKDIYQHFRDMFIQVSNRENMIVSDLKCGVNSNGEPIRWNQQQILRNDNNGLSFEECIKHKGIVKIDIIYLLNSRFIELTNVYQIVIDGESNMDYSVEQIVEEITDEYKQKIKEGNYFKSLKKLYSIMKITNPSDLRLEKLLNYFNSPIGLLYRCKSDLETLLVAINSSEFDLNEVKNSMEMIKELISAFPVENIIDEIVIKKAKNDMMKPLHKQIRLIVDVLNRDAKKFIQVNGI